MTFPRAMLLVMLALGAVFGAKCETDLEKTVSDVIATFKESMPSGLPDIGIPALDPAVLKTINININVSPFKAQCLASDISVVGASGFTITEISQIEGSNKVSVALEVSDVNANGQYDLKGKVKVGFVNIKLNSHGDLRVGLKGLKGKGTADLVVGHDGSLNLNSLQINDWTYKEVKVTLGNLIGGGVMGKTVNKLINSLVPSVVKSNRNKINDLIESKGTMLINKYLLAISGKPQLMLAHLSAAPAALDVHENDLIISEEARDILDRLALMVLNSRRGPHMKSSSVADRL